MIVDRVLLLILLKFSVVLPQENVPLTKEDDSIYSRELATEPYSEDWKTLGEIAKVLGTPLHNWGDSEKICLRGDNDIISRERIYCFDKNAVTNVTRSLHLICVNTYKTRKPNFADLHLLSERINEFGSVDYYLLLKSISLSKNTLKIEEFNYFAKIVDNVVNSRFLNEKTYFILSKLLLFLYNTEPNFTIAVPNLLLSSWRPFETNITGHALYVNPYGGYTIQPIHKNQSSADIDVNGLQIAGYVPYNLLEILAKDMPEEDKINLNVLMIFVIESENFGNFYRLTQNVKNLIGISIPERCKLDATPLLNVFFKSNSSITNWSSFGKDYLDSDEYSFDCLLDQMSYIGLKNTEDVQYYESFKDAHCTSYTFIGNTSVINFQQRNDYMKIYPKNFCLNRELKVPYLYCITGDLFDWGDVGIECFDHPVSSSTEELYQLVLNCYTAGKCTQNFNLNNQNITYVDVKLYFAILKSMSNKRKSPKTTIESLSDLLEKGINMIEKQPRNDNQIPYISDFLMYFIESKPKDFNNQLLVKSNFVYQTFKLASSNGTLGLTLHKSDHHSFDNNNITPLTKENSNENYFADKNVEVVVYLVDNIGEINISDHVITVNIFVTYNDHFSEDSNYFCKSRIIGVHHTGYGYDKSLKFAVHLKVIEGHNGGYWSVIDSEKDVLSVAFISESMNKGRRVSSFKYVH